MTEKKKRDLLQLYISGKISPEDRHALEIAALDDAFLFEALEGYTVNKITGNIPYSNPKQTKVLPIRQMLTMAASFILIAAIAFVFKQNLQPTINETAIVQFEEQNSNNKSIEKEEALPSDSTVNSTEEFDEAETIAYSPPKNGSLRSSGSTSENKPKKARQNTAVVTTSNGLSDSIDIQTLVTANEPDVSSSRISDDSDPVINAKEDSEESEVESAGQSDVIQTDVVAVENRFEKPEYADDSNAKRQQTEFNDSGNLSTGGASQPSATPSRRSRQAPQSNQILGIVKNKVDGKRLRGATVSLTESRQETITDSLGWFNVPSQQQKFKLTAKHEGFKPTVINGYFRKPEKWFMNIELEPDNFVASEVSETEDLDYYTKSSDAGIAGISLKKSYPLTGWQTFNTKWAKVKNSSQCTFDYIEFNFEVMADGSLQNIEVQATSHSDFYTFEELEECFQERIAFLESYGKWKTEPPNVLLSQRLIITLDTIYSNNGF